VKRLAFLLISFTLLSFTAFSSPANSSQLSLGLVWESVMEHYPKLISYKNEASMPGAAYQSAQGAFDPKVKFNGSLKDGFYDNERLDASLEQQTPFYGLSVETGWRKGTGNFAVYDEILNTLSDGEYYAKVKLPLLRNGMIDQARADLKMARINQKAADYLLNYQIMKVKYDAAEAYWNWILAGLQRQVYGELYKIVNDRQSAIKERVDAGSEAEIDLVENEQFIQNRRSQLNEALEKWNSSVLKLSLYYRDENGEPLEVNFEQLPKQLSHNTSTDLSPEKLRLIVQNHPLIKYQEQMVKESEVKVKLANNQRLPQLNTEFKYSQDFGTGAANLDSKEVFGGVQFEFPLLNRKARGKYKEEKFSLRSKQAKLRQSRDELKIQLNNIHQKVINSGKRVKYNKDQWQLAERVEEAEKIKFDLGQSELLKVNLRESYTAKAKVDYYSSLAQFQLNQLEYQILAGQI
jgi:cobalt-zinc-cadmium efflux system outer membrane protein